MEQYNLLSDEELISRLREGHEDIRDYLMEKHKNLVRKKARALYLIGGDNDDLIQEGMIGLYKAIRDFDPERGASFHTFADLCISRQLYTHQHGECVISDRGRGERAEHRQDKLRFFNLHHDGRRHDHLWYRWKLCNV